MAQEWSGMLVLGGWVLWDGVLLSSWEFLAGWPIAGCSFSIMLWYHAVWYGLSAPLAEYTLNTKCPSVPDNCVVS